MIVALLAMIGAVATLIHKIVHPATAVGWASTMVTITFFSGLNMMFLGLIGEYVGRMFLVTGHDPQYVVRTVHSGEFAYDQNPDAAKPDDPSAEPELDDPLAEPEPDDPSAEPSVTDTDKE